MNNYLKNNRSVGLIIVLAFLLAVSTLAFATLVLIQSQHGITYSFKGLDEVRYARGLGIQYGYWVWRYKYGNPAYFDISNPECVANPCHIRTFDLIDSDIAQSVKVRVEDINGNRQLDLSGDPKDIDVEVTKKTWNP
ncbi:MAG: hypothetical protein ABIH40_06155 [Candidatus Omnitrophota bacterium]